LPTMADNINTDFALRNTSAMMAWPTRSVSSHTHLNTPPTTHGSSMRTARRAKNSKPGGSLRAFPLRAPHGVCLNSRIASGLFPPASPRRIRYTNLMVAHRIRAPLSSRLSPPASTLTISQWKVASAQTILVEKVPSGHTMTTLRCQVICLPGDTCWAGAGTASRVPRCGRTVLWSSW